MSAVRGVVSLRRGKNVAASMRLIIRDDDREGEGRRREVRVAIDRVGSGFTYASSSPRDLILF